MCHYQTLGLRRAATFDEVKKAYKKLVLLHHPDRNAGNEETAQQKFVKIQNAYEAITDSFTARPQPRDTAADFANNPYQEFKASRHDRSHERSDHFAEYRSKHKEPGPFYGPSSYTYRAQPDTQPRRSSFTESFYNAEPRDPRQPRENFHFHDSFQEHMHQHQQFHDRARQDFWDEFYARNEHFANADKYPRRSPQAGGSTHYRGFDQNGGYGQQERTYPFDPMADYHRDAREQAYYRHQPSPHETSDEDGLKSSSSDSDRSSHETAWNGQDMSLMDMFMLARGVQTEVIAVRKLRDDVKSQIRQHGARGMSTFLERLNDKLKKYSSKATEIEKKCSKAKDDKKFREGHDSKASGISQDLRSLRDKVRDNSAQLSEILSKLSGPSVSGREWDRIMKRLETMSK